MSLAAELLEPERGSRASAASCDLRHRGEVLVKVLVSTSDQFLDGDSSAGRSVWLASVPMTSGELSEASLEAALCRFDFLGRVNVLVSMPESAH